MLLLHLRHDHGQVERVAVEAPVLVAGVEVVQEELCKGRLEKVRKSNMI